MLIHLHYQYIILHVCHFTSRFVDVYFALSNAFQYFIYVVGGIIPIKFPHFKWKFLQICEYSNKSMTISLIHINQDIHTKYLRIFKDIYALYKNDFLYNYLWAQLELNVPHMYTYDHLYLSDM